MASTIINLQPSLKTRLLSGGILVSAGKALTIVIGLVISAILARLLSPSEMGAYFLAFSIASLGIIFSQLGMDRTVVRLVAESLAVKDTGRIKEAIRMTFIFGSTGAILVSSTIYLGFGQWIALTLFQSQMISNITGLIAIWVIILTWNSLISETFRGLHAIGLATLFGGLATGFLSLVVFSILLTAKGHSNLSQIIFFSISAGGTSTLIAFLLLRSKISHYNVYKKTLSKKEVLAVTWPFMITNVVLFVLNRSDLWVLGIFCPQEEVAIYGAVLRLILLMTGPFIIMNLVIPPIIVEMKLKGDNNKLEFALRTVAAISSIPALAMMILFVSFGADVLALVYGDFFKGGQTILIILGIGQLINVWAGSCGIVLMMTGKQKLMMTITTVCAGITVIAELLFALRFGPIGVASAAALGVTIQNVIMLIIVKKSLGIWTHAKFAGVFGVIMNSIGKA